VVSIFQIKFYVNLIKDKFNYTCKKSDIDIYLCYVPKAEKIVAQRLTADVLNFLPIKHISYKFVIFS
jgi:hypothetical protein